jgi:hypothetical protein
VRSASAVLKNFVRQPKKTFSTLSASSGNHQADPAHYTESSARENLIEHVFLGELLRGLWRKKVRDLEVLRPEVDNGGYDLALEFRGLTRHGTRSGHP